VALLVDPEPSPLPNVAKCSAEERRQLDPGDQGNLVTFGLVTGFTILTAFLADVLLAPALMVLLCGHPQPSSPEDAGT